MMKFIIITHLMLRFHCTKVKLLYSTTPDKKIINTINNNNQNDPFHDTLHKLTTKYLTRSCPLIKKMHSYSPSYTFTRGRDCYS